MLTKRCKTSLLQPNVLTQQKFKEIKKIAILRANALGDFIVTLPAIKAIRTAFPHAEIVLLGKEWHKKFLVAGRTPVDRVIVVPVKQGIRNESGAVENKEEVENFLVEMRNEQFDVVLNFQGNGTSANPFIKQFKAGLTAGLCHKQSEKLDLNIEYYYYQNEAIRFLEVAKLIGATTPEIEPELTVIPQDETEADGFLSMFENRKFVVLHPIATDTRRMWPLENYGRLADELKLRKIEVVFTGAPEDKKVVEDIIYDMNYTAINACGKFSLGGLAAVLSKATLMISADTGPLHLARAVGTPTIGFYWAPNLINWGPLTRKTNRPLISWKMECPECGVVPNDPYPFEPATSACDHPFSFVRDITIEQVLKEVDIMMSDIAMSDMALKGE